MKDPEIISVKGPQSQPTSSDKKISSSGLIDNNSFEKKLKTSTKKLEQNDDELLGLIRMLSEMTSAAANQKPEGFKAAATIFSKKDLGNTRLSEIEHSHTHDQNNSSGNQSSPAGSVSKTDPQQALLEQLLAYFKSTGVPFPVMDLASKLENLNAKPDIDLIAQKIIENAALIKINGKTELVLNLKPQWLGDLKMSISSDNGTLSIQIFANGKTKELIESQLEDLKSLLAQANLNVGSLNVSVGNQNSGSDWTRENYSKDIDTSYAPAPFIGPPAAAKDIFQNADEIAMTMRRLMIYSEI
ncbi:MAG: flagellar hook-length control protein FliK [Candidatus Margulisiibacteriota bacterium]